MKTGLKLIIIGLITLFGCNKPGKETTENLDSLKTANQALYDQTMDIHDEVMPKMDDLYKVKKALQDTIINTPALAADKKVQYEAHIHFIDSASNAMMVWMRQFNPAQDSIASDAYRIYMENELKKVKELKTLMLEALKKDRHLE